MPDPRDPQRDSHPDDPAATSAGDGAVPHDDLVDLGAVRPLDPTDPRFTGVERPPHHGRERELVASRGPGGSQMDARVRIIRLALPLIVLGGVAAVAAMFWAALTPQESGPVVAGDLDAVRAAVDDRPRRVCRQEGPPCAWITEVEGSLLALSTSGPIHEEYGRQGVGWCSSSGYFGSNTTGSRYDPAGRVVAGPSPRGMDRFGLTVDDRGRVLVDFGTRTAGPRANDPAPRIPPEGEDCDPIPFDRDPDLDVPDDEA